MCKAMVVFLEVVDQIYVSMLAVYLKSLRFLQLQTISMMEVTTESDSFWYPRL